MQSQPQEFLYENRVKASASTRSSYIQSEHKLNAKRNHKKY